MKNKNRELDVDFIGEQGRDLTAAEAQAITAFIKASKAKQIASAKSKATVKKSRSNEPA